jgi:hypothetical protein
VKHRIVKHFGIIILHHSNTGSGRRNNITVIRKIVNEFFANTFAHVPITGIESGLSAAGLFGIVVYSHVKFLQNLHHVFGGVRKNLVNKAGDKYVNNHE